MDFFLYSNLYVMLTTLSLQHIIFSSTEIHVFNTLFFTVCLHTGCHLFFSFLMPLFFFKYREIKIPQSGSLYGTTLW